ncbi:unnamed protein product [Diamesa tonsa]
MKYCAILLVSVIGLAVAAEFGAYVPKAYFTINENGEASPVVPIESEVLFRQRRQIQPFGQPQFGFPNQFPSFPFPQGGQGQGSFSGISTSQTLNSRFGDDEPVVTGNTQTITSNNGVYQATNTVIKPDGSVHTNKQSGRVRRNEPIQAGPGGQSQLQSQNGKEGNQFQSQTQGNQAGGQQQTQSQNQGQNVPQVNQQDPSYSQGQNVPQNQGQIAPQGNQQNIPQQGQQGQQGQQDPSYSQQGQQGPQGNYNQGPQGNYPQGQQGQFPFASPFGIGAFGPQAGFGFPQAGFGQPAFGFGANPFAQPGFGAPAFGAPLGGQGVQTTFDNRFGEDEIPTGVVGSSSVITSNNGVVHATNTVLRPDGQITQTHHTNQKGKTTLAKPDSVPTVQDTKVADVKVANVKNADVKVADVKVADVKVADVKIEKKQ